MLPLQKRYQYLNYFRKVINQGNFPLGMIVYFGPDDKTVTKILGIVLVDAQNDPITKQWLGENIAENPKTISAIGNFFQKYCVSDVVMTEGVIGCPHEEGLDYPLGGECAECTFWRDT